jgi:hypothetical protein
MDFHTRLPVTGRLNLHYLEMGGNLAEVHSVNITVLANSEATTPQNN